MRKPTPDNLKTLRALLDKAGSKRDFAAWVKAAEQLPTRPAHRPKAEYDQLLAGIELLARAAERDGMKRFTALRLYAQAIGNIFGKAKPGNLARNIAKKLRERGFTDRELDELVKKHGVADPSKVTITWHKPDEQ
jgi:hypothetical protein